MNLEEKLKLLQKKYPLVPHTHPGQLSSTVRRMWAEKEFDIPIVNRTGFAISVETGKSANEMNEQEWEKFYNALCEELKTKYPSLYNSKYNIK